MTGILKRKANTRKHFEDGDVIESNQRSTESKINESNNIALDSTEFEEYKKKVLLYSIPLRLKNYIRGAHK